MSVALTRDGDAWLSAAGGVRWVPVIGLEVHCQLDTRTKLFCGCAYRFGAEPNSLTCPVCTGQPGALPVVNAAALELALRAALAVGAEIASQTHFDRKNYFYCDIPKNYQISQLERPFCTGGGIELSSGKRVRLHRIHLEEDAGKAVHDRGQTTLVDLNRAGVPLIESVTEADISSPEEAHEYLTALREIVQYVGASAADMEKGELRCDVNVSVRPEGEELRAKVEVKNLNSFKSVKEALEHEIARQIEAYESGDEARFPVQETRLYDAQAGETRTMRAKEEAHDYRYFPEPDIPPLTIPSALVAEQRRLLPELPAARRRRYREELGLSDYDAGVLTQSRDVADLFETVARLSQRPKESANWISNEVLRAFSDPEIPAARVDELALRPHDLAELIGLVTAGTVNTNAGRTVLREMMKSGRPARALIGELGLEQVQDEGQLEQWCRAALAGQERTIADVRAGKTKALGAVMGRVMRASQGKADPRRVRALLLRIIGARE